jgi:hypothetical protein
MPDNDRATSLHDIVTQFFRDDGWRFQAVEGFPILQMGYSGQSGAWTCYARWIDEMERFVFYSVLPIKVPEAARPAAAEFVTRANYGIILGNFEMDYADGEVRYKTSIDVEGGQLVPAMIKTLVYANVLTVDRYLPGLLATVYGGALPAEAIVRVEGV